jgi:hypothetical protein
VFGKSFVRPPTPRARRPQPIPTLPWRTFALAALAVGGSIWGLIDHYTRKPPPARAPSEIPAPEVIQVDR